MEKAIFENENCGWYSKNKDLNPSGEWKLVLNDDNELELYIEHIDWFVIKTWISEHDINFINISPSPPLTQEQKDKIENIHMQIDNVFKFKEDLTNILNKHSISNMCNTPDFILSDHITEYLISYSKSINNRDKWYNNL